MSEINKLIHDIWKITYQGIDIRTIILKSDLEKKSKKKSFNYRIVIITKNGKEIDMKGHCSMG